MGTDTNEEIPSDERVADLLALGLDQEDAACQCPSLAAGTKVDDLEILEEVGRGGMGVVYRAREVTLDRIVAVKMLRPEIAGDSSAGKLFREEATKAASLEHPNIVPVFGIDKETPPRYFWMQFVRGQSLAQKVEEEGYLSGAQAVGIAIQVCDALRYAHAEGIVHRDIKPSNILLEDNLQKIKITDFGIAQVTRGPRLATQRPPDADAGTRGFISPEQGLGSQPDGRWDIYSLGVTLYYALTGKLPAQTSPPREAKFVFKRRPYLPPSRLNPSVSRELDAVILRMLAATPRRRYPNCTVLMKELQALLAPRQRTGAGRLAWAAIAVLCVAAVAVPPLARLLWQSTATPHGAPRPAEPLTPFRAVTRPSGVTVLDQRDRPVFAVKVDGKVRNAEVVRLFADRPPCLVLGVWAGGEDTGKVFVYDHTGKQMWARHTIEPYPYRSGVNQMAVQDLLVADLWQDGSPEIVVVSNDLGWYPSKISIYDRDGNHKATYWHPGNIQNIYTFQPRGGGRLRLLAWGFNNGIRSTRPGSAANPHYQGLCCLDPATMSGEAPPRPGTIGKGRELWYGVLLPQKVRLVGLRFCPVDPGRPSGPIEKIEVALSDGHFLYLDEDGNPAGRGSTDAPSGPDTARVELIK